MTGTEVVATEPSRRGPVLLVAAVVALVAAVAGIRLYVTRERSAPSGREYVVLSEGGFQHTTDGATHGYLLPLRSVWSEPVTVRSVVPLDAAGREAPAVWTSVLDPAGAGQEQMYGAVPRPAMPYVLAPRAGAALGLRVPGGCATVVRVTAFRVRVEVPDGVAEQVIDLLETHGHVNVETGTGCAAASPAG